VIRVLKSLGISFVPSRGSHFVWADFSNYLEHDSEEGEMQLWMDIYDNTKILLTPGVGFQHQKHGLFRIVHTAVSTPYLSIAMEKLKAYLENRA
jgi:1-aminocyclopropane-1-carboxylate synthase